MTPSFGFLLFFGVAVARECADLADLEWQVTDAEWWVEDAQFFFEADCPEPVPDKIRLDRVPRDLHRVECSLAGGAQQCTRTTSQYRRLAQSWQSRAKRQAGSLIQRKARCDAATRELETAKEQLERAQQAVEACKNPQAPIGGVAGGDFSPTITYKSLYYRGSKLAGEGEGEARKFVTAVRSGKPGRGYCQKELDTLDYRNSETCKEGSTRGSTRNIGFDIIVNFMEKRKSSTWHFDFGVDFGMGGVIYVDNQLVESHGGDIWWARNEQHANHLGFTHTFTEGEHTLEIIGAEKCCDGPSRVKFCSDCNGRQQDMEVVSIDALA
jgi:hypothetical protein